MESTNKSITVSTIVKTSIEKVWKYWTTPEDIMQWNSASEDWHTPRCENDLRVGGKFFSRMEAKDGSFGFDFGGVYHDVIEHKLISYTMGDGRKVEINFWDEGDATKIIETFEAESTNSFEQQKAGWQSILDNFKKYAESR
ncbi:MAG TPA: SRPBCC family protein [Hanamia sp.]|jgi:uncharacterized protein YndB with AHSA1/START domain|nr:SRPBCC family protein [Hanamia sp.]